jgi:hypothetical protein
MNYKYFIAIAVLFLVAAGVFAQTDTDAHTVTITIAPIAAIALNNTTDVGFSTTAPVLPGDDVGPTPLAHATDASKRLWYTALNGTGLTRRITVGSDVNAPAGTNLTVASVVEAGAGTTAGTVAVSTVTVNAVTAIPSVATGRTGTDGAGLAYDFWVSAPASLVEGAYVLTVTYTLTDDA